ncbi:nitrophenyl compound nitroreductase subunit ArsF family protein [Shewanella sp. MEBiC00475]|uniref:nitrophenyl compound nitroreductase subunit ArsF family protein n=1 Tax=Shewanella sp. MEBiC00475 TaxID=2575361 RepID=UPI0010C06AB0|nr:nitrophenyl compound nitroreductase subunit ArsF family protein [Shewanella sp. MEBiC00475]
MNAKIIVRYFLLGVVCLGFAIVGYQQFGVSSGNALTKLSDVDKTIPKLNNGINVYYFHGNQRCTTCLRMEKFTKDTLTEHFQQQVANGELQLNLVNVDLNQNQHYIDDYELIFRTVVVTHSNNGVETEWDRLDRTWELANDETAYQAYLAQAIQAMLVKTHG